MRTFARQIKPRDLRIGVFWTKIHTFSLKIKPTSRKNQNTVSKNTHLRPANYGRKAKNQSVLNKKRIFATKSVREA